MQFFCSLSTFCTFYSIEIQRLPLLVIMIQCNITQWNEIVCVMSAVFKFFSDYNILEIDIHSLQSADCSIRDR